MRPIITTSRAHWYAITPPMPGDHAFCGHVFGNHGAGMAGRLSRKCKACKQLVNMHNAVIQMAKDELASL